ncbi:LysR family transcriptional regulator [Heyndrickxia ginsengihumi]|uniref:LysR family transcriptional regulator n=1 Tax=Heyndrickxia ginsengihumi TaxID=363870 RepID=UPI003D2113F8
MELRQLKTFAIAAEHLNFTKAAKILNFTQPTVSLHIQALEQELNQALFLRIDKKLILTPAGKLLQQYTNELLSTVQKIEQEFLSLSPPKGTITIAAAEAYCTNYLLPITTEYLKRHPKVEIELLSRQTNNVVEGVLNRHYDIGIIAGEMQDSVIANTLLEEEELLFVVSRALYEQFSADQLLTEFPFMRFRTDGYFQHMMDVYIDKLPFIPCQTILVESEKAIKQGIINHKGIGVMASNYVKEELETGELIALRLFEEKIIVKTSLITLEEHLQINTIQSFCEMTKCLWDKIHGWPAYS